MTAQVNPFKCSQHHQKGASESTSHLTSFLKLPKTGTVNNFPQFVWTVNHCLINHHVQHLPAEIKVNQSLFEMFVAHYLGDIWPSHAANKIYLCTVIASSSFLFFSPLLLFFFCNSTKRKICAASSPTVIEIVLWVFRILSSEKQSALTIYSLKTAYIAK